MVIGVDCPWCNENLWVTRDALDGEVECSACDIRFELAPDALIEVAALAA